MLKRSDIKVLVLTGDGINCERETAMAFSEWGVDARIIHIADLIEEPAYLEKSHILALPGGFSFGDEIGSGQILALKLKYSLGQYLEKFVADKKLIIGICNGFQALVRLGLLPKPFNERTMTLAHNRQGHFIDQWVELEVTSSQCEWTKKLIGKKISLPMRHGEGKIVFSGDENTQKSHYQNLKNAGQIPLNYLENVNGSYERIAGVCDPSGRIFGLMPHPEVATSLWLSPNGARKKDGQDIGALFFESGIEYCEKNF